MVAEIISFMERNAEWLFGSTSVAALALGAAQLYWGRSAKAQPDKKDSKSRAANTSPSASSRPSSTLTFAVLALLLIVSVSSGYFVVAGGNYTDESLEAGGNAAKQEAGRDANSTQAEGDATNMQAGRDITIGEQNKINGGDGSTNTIATGGSSVEVQPGAESEDTPDE